MNLYVCNAFSLSMINPDHQLVSSRYGGIIKDQLVFPRVPVPLSEENTKSLINSLMVNGWKLVSAVGHSDTATLFSRLLGLEIQMNRISVKLDNPGDVAIIGQLVGPRLPEGCTTLPEGATIQWWKM